MGRRSLHSPEELRQLILNASRTIVESDGLSGLSAREIARLIGYSPGTLYNIFENLDDVLLTLQAQLLTDLVDAMKTVPAGGTPASRIDGLAEAFVDFALSNRQMWAVLSAHSPAESARRPLALHDTVNALIAIVADALAPLMKGAQRSDVDLAARALWGGVHGLTAICVTSKGPTINAGNAQVYVRTLTSNFVKGLSKA